MKRFLSGENPFLPYLWFVEYEADTAAADVSLRERLGLWRYGFLSRHGELSDFDTHSRREYLNAVDGFRLCHELNGAGRYVVDDKLSQYWMLSDRPENRPAAYGLVDDGAVHGLAGTELAGDSVAVCEWLPETLRREGALVLKALRSSGGKEVLVCRYDDGFVLDGDDVEEDELCDRVSDLSRYLASEYVDQHAYADKLYPDATNTIRVLTVWDDQEHEPYVPAAIHRVGTDRSSPVDNCSSGGLSASIELETGTLGPAVRPWGSEPVVRHSSHPDTGAQIEGVRVPAWDAVVETLAAEVPYVPFVGGTSCCRSPATRSSSRRTAVRDSRTTRPTGPCWRTNGSVGFWTGTSERDRIRGLAPAHM